MGIKPITKYDWLELVSGVFLTATFAMWIFAEYKGYKTLTVQVSYEIEKTVEEQLEIQDQLKSLTSKIQRLESSKGVE